jgi:hypothetical protein
MAKKGKVVQLQSPENYIRTRARNLEIFECLINPDWKERGIANVVVARKHTNGNVTAAIYLVDLFCLGVKDTMYLFNEIEAVYREKLQPIEDVNPFIKIEYILAHNIIFAANEFAGDYGFNPHKDFNSVTKYLLEEDNDDIELIDIECGQDGKPSYFQGVDDNKATVARILNQLERTAGRGNFNFTIEEDFRKYEQESDYDDEFDDEFDTGDDDDDDITYDEAVTAFRKYIGKFDSLKKDEAQSFFEAVEVLFETLVDEDKFDVYYEEFFYDLNFELESEEIPDEMLGLPKSGSHNFDKLKSQLKPILELPEKKFEKGKKLVSELKKDYADVPLLAFLELHFAKDKADEMFNEKLKHYEELFPDYPLIKLTSLIHSFLKNLDQTTETDLISLHDIFTGRVSIHDFEMQQYLVYAVFVVLMGSDKSRLAAFHEALVDLEFPDDFMEFTYSLIMAEKMKAVLAITAEIE